MDVLQRVALLPVCASASLDILLSAAVVLLPLLLPISLLPFFISLSAIWGAYQNDGDSIALRREVTILKQIISCCATQVKRVSFTFGALKRSGKEWS